MISHPLSPSTTIQGKTHKKDWDKFDRQIKQSGFPQSLTPFLKRGKKVDLFGIWLDNGEDWDRVTCHVDRYMESRNLSRKQWTAVQAKVLKSCYNDDEKFNAVIKQRSDAGLFYLDDMFPNDPLDWVLPKTESLFFSQYMVNSSPFEVLNYFVYILASPLEKSTLLHPFMCEGDVDLHARGKTGSSR